MAGRKPKPTLHKQLAGNPGHRPLNISEPRPHAHTGRMPHGLSEHAQKLWQKVAVPLAELGILTEIDVPAAIMMAEHYGIARQAATRIAEEGLIAVDENGAKRKHPLLQVLRDNSAAFRQYAAEFGMTPSSRTRLHTEQAEQMSLADLLFGEAQVGEDVGYQVGDGAERDG